MRLEWNKVTWYSKLLALIALIVSLFGGFYFGKEYEKAKLQIEEGNSIVNQFPAHPSSSAASLSKEEIVFQKVESWLCMVAAECRRELTFYSSGKLIQGATISVLSPEVVQGTESLIRSSGVMNRPCTSSNLVDASINYRVSVDGKTREIDGQGSCSTTLQEIEQFVTSGGTANVKKEGQPEPQEYIACGCGCCGGTTPSQEICLYRSKGDSIAAIIEADREISKQPVCTVAGCSVGVKYKYCD